ncbi:MAG: ribosome biogenesis GTPase Der [Bacillota bacterium]|jgi:GTP-binding protein
MAKPIVAIVGRPNVGKSTLFNRLIKERLAIVEDRPGVTRDRLYSECEWLGHSFLLVDTGGIKVATQDPLESQTSRQAEMAVKEADLIVFIVDGRQGLTMQDHDVANLLRQAKKPVILVVNKVEGNPDLIYDFYALGLGDPLAVSAEHGLNTGDLLDMIVSHLSEENEEQLDEAVIKVSVVGRPNVGKSSLVNALIGEERVIVSDLPGTTRDAIDIDIKYGEQELLLIDTAGMRRRGKIDDPVERYSVMRALRAVDRCDVALLIIDATEGITEQDQRIAGYILEGGKACVIIFNKWDLISKDNDTMRQFNEEVQDKLSFLPFAPVMYISAKTGQRVAKVFDTVLEVAKGYSQRVPTARLNEVVTEAVAMHEPPSGTGQRVRIFYVSQPQVKPPLFVFHCNRSDIHFSYRRYLENKLREAFGFSGTPIKMIFRGRKDKDN